RYGRAVIGKASRPQPPIRETVLSTKRNLKGVVVVQVDRQGPLRLRRDTQRGLTKLCPILPPEISHQRELRCELIQRAGHKLHRLRLPGVDLGAEQPALVQGSAETRAKIGDERMKAKFEIDR